MRKHRYIPKILIISINVKNILYEYKVINLILQCLVGGTLGSGSGYSTSFRNL